MPKPASDIPPRAEAVARTLPHGWSDVARQAAIWFGFAIAYQVVRGALRGDDATAMRNGWDVIHAEQRLGLLFEPNIQTALLPLGALIQSFNWVYWLSEFVVLGGCLTWIYLRRNGSFTRVRNTLLLANTIALIGYVLVPTAPPRFFPSLGFVDTLDATMLNQGSAVVQLASNPFAAMPSVHAADALIIGFAMAALTRTIWTRTFWLLWPPLVWTSVVVTANHFWLDIAAGIMVAAIAAAVRRSPRSTWREVTATVRTWRGRGEGAPGAR